MATRLIRSATPRGALIRIALLVAAILFALGVAWPAQAQVLGVPTTSNQTITVGVAAAAVAANTCNEAGSSVSNSGGAYVFVNTNGIYASFDAGTTTPSSSTAAFAAATSFYYKPINRLRMIRQTADATVFVQCAEGPAGLLLSKSGGGAALSGLPTSGTQGDVIYADTATTWARLTGAAGVLHGAVAANPSWSLIVNADIANATIDFATKGTGLVPTANGGTGVNSSASNGIVSINGGLWNATAVPATRVVFGAAGNLVTSDAAIITPAAGALQATNFYAGSAPVTALANSFFSGGRTFAQLTAADNGTLVYCSDCNATCAAGASTGKWCGRTNGAWVGAF